MSANARIPSEFTRVVATRALTVLRPGRDAACLQLEIGEPVRDVETVGGMDWRCSVRWREGGAVSVRNACGVDAMQALQLAMQRMADDLAALADEPGVRLLFLGEPFDARTGLPRMRRPGDAASG